MSNHKKINVINWLFQKGTILFGMLLLCFFIFNPTTTSLIDKKIVFYLLLIKEVCTTMFVAINKHSLANNRLVFFSNLAWAI